MSTFYFRKDVDFFENSDLFNSLTSICMFYVILPETCNNLQEPSYFNMLWLDTFGDDVKLYFISNLK